jgi:hypothetical protein
MLLLPQMSRYRALGRRSARIIGFIVANGPQPVEGWGTLKPGQFFEFVMVDRTSQIFPGTTRIPRVLEGQASPKLHDQRESDTIK